jgi:hypothetical protein
MENKIPLLEEVLDQFENGDLIAENEARKVYLTQQHQAKGIITWVHDHELRGHSLLRKMGKSANRDLLRQTKEKL